MLSLFLIIRIMAKFYLLRYSVLFGLCMLAVLQPSGVMAQSQIFQFQVVSEKTKAPVPFCSVQVLGKKNSAVGDEMGFVALRADASDTLVFYQLGFYLLKLPVAAASGKPTKVFLKVKSVQLDEVNVTTKKFEVFEENNYTVFLDFEFYDDNILCLANKGGRNNVLLLTDMQGNKLLEKKLTISGDDLFKDCFGNIHIVAADSVYQVFYDYSQLLVLPAFPIIDYQNFLLPCQAAFNDKYIFKIKQYRSLKNAYLYYDILNNTKKTIACVADSEAISGFNMDFDIMYFLGQRRKGAGYEYTVTDLHKNLDKFREELALPFEYTNLLRPVESELKLIDTTLLLFDYTNSNVYHYTRNGDFICKKVLQNFPSLLPKLNYDKEAGTVILTSLNNRTGLLSLYRYNPGTQKLTHKFTIEDFHYIKNFQIKENYLFHINREKTNQQTNTKLVKLPIVWQKM